MKVNFAHVCDYASVSKEGKLSAMGIFTRIYVTSLPAVHPLMFLAFELEVRPAELGHPVKLGIKLVDADGQKMVESEADVKVAGTVTNADPVQIPQFVAFGGMPIPRIGRYSFDIFVNDAWQTSASFEVVKLTAPPASAG